MVEIPEHIDDVYEEQLMSFKLRAYYHFIKRHQFHKEAFGVHPIRAVLIETTDEARARKLMELAEQPGVIGRGKRSALFWAYYLAAVR